jgi:hypothetical protein
VICHKIATTNIRLASNGDAHRVSTINLFEGRLKEIRKKKFFRSGNGPLMSFKHLRMINSASKSKCLKITLKVIKFSKPEKNSPLNHLRGGLIPLIPLWRKPCALSILEQIRLHV